MAPKRTSLLDKPPPASPPAEESEGSGSGSGSGSEYETSSDEESQQTQPPKPTSSVVEAAPPKKPVAEKKAPPPPKKADGESESESESDSEEVAEETPAKQQPPPKSPAPTSIPPAKAASGSKKRRTEAEAKPEAASKKRPKKDSDDPASAPAKNKPLFQRVWSNEDEIAILEGMIAYSAKNGVSPNSNLAAFHDYIKKFLKFDVVLPQLKSKMTRLKKRYNTCVRKENNGQKPVNPDKPHEAKVFDLLVKVWGGNVGEGSSGINGGQPLKKQKQKQKKKINGGLPPKNLKPPASSDIVVLDKCLGDAGFPADLLKQGLELVGARKRAEMEEEWRKFRVAELELCASRTQLMGEQTTLILEAVKSSGH